MTNDKRYPIAVAFALALAATGGLLSFTAQHESVGPVEGGAKSEFIAQATDPYAAFESAITGTYTMRTRAYPDPGYGWKVPTICFGHTRGVKRGDMATPDQCLEFLRQDYEQLVAPALTRYVTVDVTVGQATALGSFVFNVGAPNFATSTLLKKLNAGDCYGAAAQFPRWNKSNGKVLGGLVTQRADERARFEPDCEVWK
jgi:lysozyme